MSNNLANLMVGFGLDLSALQKDAPEAFRILNSQTMGMSAEMKRASREGAESFRLIDEALGIHVSRPLTRILTQEFPALASTLQSLLGAGVIGALGVAAFEGFDKAAKSIERAQHAEDALEASTRKVGETFTDALQSYEKAAALRGLSGLGKQLFEIDYSSVEEGRKKIDELAKAMEEESKAAAEAHKWTTELLAGIGNAVHVVFNSQSTLGVEAIGKQFAEFQRRFDDLSKLDALYGTRESAKYVADQISAAEKSVATMTAMKITTTESFLGAMSAFVPASHAGFSPQPAPQVGFTQPEIDRQKEFLDNLQKIQQILTASAGDTKGRENEALKADAAERQLKAQEAISSLYKEMGSSLAKLQPETDPIKKLDAEISGFRAKAEADFRAIGESAASALQVRAALAGLDQYEVRLDRLKVMLEGDLAKQQLDQAGFSMPSATAKLPNVGSTTPLIPQLGDGGTAGAQLDAFTKDLPAELKAAAAAYADVETPAQKYQLAQSELNLLLEKGLIDWGAYTAALQKASDAMVQGDDHIHKMQEDLQKLLERSDDASAGVQAFFKQLQIDSSENGKMAFSLLNTGLKGFEDELTKAVFTGKEHWSDLFRSMSEEAFKFMLNKDIANLFKMIGGTPIGQNLGGILGIGAQPGVLPPGAMPGNPTVALPPGVFGSGVEALASSSGTATGAAAGGTLAAAAGTLQAGSTTLMTAATALQAAATGLQANGGGFSSFIPGGGGGNVDAFASGTDDAPGGFAWVGERGRELVGLPGGSSVTPAESLRSGGGDNHYYDMRGSIVSEEVMKKADAARMMNAAKPGWIGEALANFSAIQEHTAGAGR